MELHLNGGKADLPPDTVFAVTVQSNDITRPDTVQSSYSNSLTLPFSEHNHHLLGNANQVTSQSDVPYRKLDCQVLHDGMEVLPLPKAHLLQAQEGYEVDVFSGALDFFERLGDKSIQELDLSRFDHVRNPFTVVTGANGGRTPADGYIYEPISNGKPFSLDTGIWAEDMYPSVFARTIFEQILTEAGVWYDGIADEYWDRLVLPFSNPKPVHTPDYPTYRVISDDYSDPYFTVTEYGVLKIYVQANMTRISTNPNAVPKLCIEVKRAGVVIFNRELEMHRLGYYELKADFRVESYEELSDLKVYANKLNWTADSANISTGTYQGGYYFDEEHFFLTPWSVARNLPDIKQKDFFKAIRSLFDLMVTFDAYRNCLVLQAFNTLNANKEMAQDWSVKLVDAEQTAMQYRFGEFAQRNWFRYKEDPMGGYGDASLQIDDLQLEAAKTIIELPFAASNTQEGVLHVPLFEAQLRDPADYDAEVATIAARNSGGFGDRQKVLVKDATADPMVREGWAIYERVKGRFNSIDGWAIITQAGYFYKGNTLVPRLSLLNLYPTSFYIKQSPVLDLQVHGRASTFWYLSFAQLLPTRYATLQGVLNRCKGITPAFLLSVQDVQNYDPSIPIWLDQYQSYFYLNSINEFTGLGPTECQLWRL